MEKYEGRVEEGGEGGCPGREPGEGVLRPLDVFDLKVRGPRAFYWPLLSATETGPRRLGRFPIATRLRNPLKRQPMYKNQPSNRF